MFGLPISMDVRLHLAGKLPLAPRRFVMFLFACCWLLGSGASAQYNFVPNNSTQNAPAAEQESGVQQAAFSNTSVGQSLSPSNSVNVDPFVAPASAKALSSGSLALKPRSDGAGEKSEGVTKPKSTSFSSVITMFTSLLVVLSLFFGLMLLLNKANGAQGNELPREVFQVLGTSRIAGRHPLFLLRLGNKLVLVHAGNGEVQTITEVNDAAEVDRLCGSCEENQPNSLTQSFKQVLKHVTDGGNGSKKSFAEGLRFRRKRDDDTEELSPAVALLAKEKP